MRMVRSSCRFWYSGRVVEQLQRCNDARVGVLVQWDTAAGVKSKRAASCAGSEVQLTKKEGWPKPPFFSLNADTEA